MMIDLGLGVLSAVAVTAVLLALGERIRLLLRIPSPPSFRPALLWGIGSWTLGLVVLLLGLAGLLRPIPLILALALAAMAGRWSRLPIRHWRLSGYLLAGAPLLAVALAPPFFYDAWVYHLGLPWQALKDGAIRPHPGNLFSTFPPLAQLIYALPLSWGAVRAPALIHLFGFLTAALAARGIASRLGASRPAAWMAGLCLLYLPVAPLLGGFPSAESWAIAGTLASVGLALSARGGPGRGLAAGWMAGIAAAARLQGLLWAALCAPLLLLRRRAPAALAVFAAGAAAGSAPWWLKNALLLRDPLAPLGWSRPGIETLWLSARSNLNLAANAPDLLDRAARSLAGEARLLVPLAAASFLSVACSRRLRPLMVAGIASAGALGWALTGALPRFLVPAVVLLLAAAVSGKRRIGAAVATAAVAVTLLPGLSSTWGMFRKIGGLSADGPAARVYPALLVSNPYPGFLAASALPRNARVLFLAEPRGFLFPRPYETSSQHDRSGLSDLLKAHPSPEEAAARLRELGYTHLLINVPEMRRLGRSYPVVPWTDTGGRDAFVALTRLLDPPVLQVDEIVIYSLVPGSGRPAATQ